MTNEDSDELGDVYSLTAIKSDTRLFLFHHEGKRSTEDAIELFKGVEKMRNASSPIPVFISDDWDAFEEGLLNVYGKLEFSTSLIFISSLRSLFDTIICDKNASLCLILSLSQYIALKLN